MSKLLKSAPVLYLFYLLAITAVSAVFLYRGFVFVAYNSVVWFFLNLAAEGTFTALCAVGRKKAGKPTKIIAQFLPLGALLYFLATRLMLDNVGILLIVFHGFLCFVSCFILSLLYNNPRAVRIVSGVFNGVLLVVLLHISLASVLFSIGSLKFDNITVIRQVPSPEKTYTAIISSVNRGVYGRYTIVDVQHDAAMIDLGFGQFEKTEQFHVTEGNEYKTIRLEWDGDSTLLINDEAYPVE